jgi:SHS family lactate transporter-like MFS transporter
MADIIFYSAMELLTAFAPNFTVFLILRALFGIGMGGEWGLGASLAMESLPAKARGLFSGILQQGYAFGYLLAAVFYWIIFPIFGWRGLFVAGALPAALVIYIRARVPESPVWERQRQERKRTPVNVPRLIKQHGALFLYAVLLMTAFNYMSHGTQDLYPTFLEKQRGFGVAEKSMMTIIYALGAICGGTVVRFHVATMGPETQHYSVGVLWDASDSGLDFRSGNRAARHRRISNAIHGAGSMGRCARAPERTIAG